MTRQFLAVLSLIFTSFIILPAAVTAQQYCETVQFPRGAYTHSVQSYANPHQSTCFYLDVRRGQEAQVRILQGPVFFTTSDTNGQFNNVQFFTLSGRLYVYVHTNYSGNVPFTIQFTFI